ncbi:flavin reductase [Mangrovicoccus algicola]|uniref:Flavin reductase n=1 Tax=Mangrovicoccus algicola TaxID=2771008 RepID=A0A8J7CHM2_9RHOB|nr:flavin reductase [Mangrovicoccus algicola]MBE3638355.1 flavin reductase [Mangrovicoccus algicola]
MSDIAQQGSDRPGLVSREVFRDGMACLAGAVNIVTTDGPGGRAGFTATAVCSVTDDPPTLLVCLNRASSAMLAFAANEAICVNTVGPRHRDLAMIFGGRAEMKDRFAGTGWGRGASGAPVLEGAVASFDCRVSHRHVCGTHEVIFCEVLDVIADPTAPGSAYFGRRFHDLPV